jgi:hypothetical protein
MSGQNGAQHAGQDDAARLDSALDRIARAAAQARQDAASALAQTAVQTGLHANAPHATTGPDTSDIAARVDALIANIRGVLGTQGM